MTITDTRPSAHFADLALLDDPTIDLQTALRGRRPQPAALTEPDLLDIDDIRRILPSLNPARLQPHYSEGDCRYSHLMPGGTETYEPSCIVGWILLALDAEYFRTVAAHAIFPVPKLPGITRVFTPRAIDFLHSVQKYADGVETGEQLAWGEAIREASFDCLVNF